jgi:hypothetical protein
MLAMSRRFSLGPINPYGTTLCPETVALKQTPSSLVSPPLEDFPISLAWDRIQFNMILLLLVSSTSFLLRDWL